MDPSPPAAAVSEANRPAGFRFTLRGLLLAAAAIAVIAAPARWLGLHYVTSVLVSVVLLLGVSVALWRRSTIGSFVACAVGFISLPLLFHAGLMPNSVAIHTVATAFLVAVTIPLTDSPRVRVVACGLAFVLCYASYVWGARQRQLRIDELLARYPPQSVADRLATVTSRTQPVSADRIETFDRLYDSVPIWSSRTHLLRSLHNESARQFAVAPGFGFSRMPNIAYVDDDRFAAAPSYRATLPQQYALRRTATGSDLLSAILDHSLADFGSADRTGLVESTTMVAGFAAHAFTELPAQQSSDADRESRPIVRLHRLELLGYAYHPDPVVYISDTLPNMETVAETPTRSPNGFEAAALDKLIAGDDLVIESPKSPGSVTQMLGAVRAGKSCTSCHEVAAGALLGAFSYELVLPENYASTSETIGENGFE